MQIYIYLVEEASTANVMVAYKKHLPLLFFPFYSFHFPPALAPACHFLNASMATSARDSRWEGKLSLSSLLYNQ